MILRYLLASDNPCMMLVTIPLSKNNFLIWSRSIRRALAAKNKIGFINRAVPESAREPEQNAWKRNDEMVSSWIINSISKDIVETFVYASSTTRLWMDLEEQFGASKGPQIYQI